ncbi:MAG: VCBS repeat-containing protein, partial [Phycisphaerales bacterium]|nr:VCBS repeat-containing protein [Phycisphaerales bacterium]
MSRTTIAATLPFCIASTNVSAHEQCLPSPLFSGNVVLRMPSMPNQPQLSLQARSTVLGDFDGDGRTDIIHGTYHGSLVYFRGRADWWDFDPPVIINLPFATPPPGMGWLITALAAADFNEDGDLDLVVGDDETFHPPGDRIHIMLGNGDGTFQSGVAQGPVFQQNEIPIDFAVADFNGDEDLDLLYGSRKAWFTVLWGVGNGTFPTFTQTTAETFTDHVAAADIDLDGDMDAVLDLIQAPPLILRNSGDGTFAQEPFAVTSVISSDETFCHLNGDPWPDMVVARSEPGIELVYVLINDGTGHYPTLVQYPITMLPSQSHLGSNLLATDLDGDGRDEIVFTRIAGCSSTQSNDQVAVFHNPGNGTLVEPPVLYHFFGFSATNEQFLAAADLNGDSRADVIAQGYSNATLLLNDGDGAFMTNHGAPMGQAAGTAQGLCGFGTYTDFHSLTHGDVNNDGRFDLVGVREGTDTGHSFLECTVMLQDAQGSFTTLSSVPLVERYTTGLELADFDLDNNLDMAVCTSSATATCGGDVLRVAFGNGNGTFDPWVIYHVVGRSPSSVATGDLNNDDAPDLVVSESNSAICPGPPGPRGVSVFLNNGDGTFASAVQYDIVNPGDYVTIADVNGDKHPDLAVLSTFEGVTILLNNGNGTFAAPSPFYADSATWWLDGVELADVSGDDRPDMLATIYYYPNDPTDSGGISVLLNEGSGVFTPVGVVGVGTPYDNPTVADLNGDGDADLITMLGYVDTGAYNIRLGNGDGTFGESVLYGGGVVKPIVRDFDNDGRLDLGSPMGSSPDSDSNAYLGFSILLNRMCPAPDPCPADIAPGEGDDTVNVLDLLAVISAWGPCADPENCDADIAPPGGNDVVNVLDLLALIGNWG